MVKIKDLDKFVEENFWCTNVYTGFEAENTAVDYLPSSVKLEIEDLEFDADDIDYIVENYKEMVIDSLLDNLSKKEREELAKKLLKADK